MKEFFFLRDGLVHRDDDGLLRVDGRVFDWGVYGGRRVVAYVSHVPGLPGGRWGLGGCYWEPTGACPYGHADAPERMLQWEARGAVTATPEGGWAVGGSPVPDPAHLEGHACRVAVCLDPEELKTMRVHEAAEYLRENLDWLEALRKLGVRGSSAQ